MATTLAGYTPGTAGANWFVSNEMKTRFDEMAKAIAMAIPSTLISLSDGYISRYELIRQLATKYGYADQALKDKVTNIPSNGTVTPEEWNALESYFNDDVSYGSQKPAAYKYIVHPYLQGNNSFVSEVPNKPNSDLRRIGTYVKIKSGGFGAQSQGNWNVAEWMLKNSHRYGFFFVGPIDSDYLYQPNWTFGENFQSQLDTYGNRIWIKWAADNFRFGGFNLDINNVDDRIKQELQQNTMPTLDQVIQKLNSVSNPSNESIKSAVDAAKSSAPWLYLAEKF